jgi:hypothetical protein
MKDVYKVKTQFITGLFNILGSILLIIYFFPLLNLLFSGNPTAMSGAIGQIIAIFLFARYWILCGIRYINTSLEGIDKIQVMNEQIILTKNNVNIFLIVDDIIFSKNNIHITGYDNSNKYFDFKIYKKMNIDKTDFEKLVETLKGYKEELKSYMAEANSKAKEQGVSIQDYMRQQGLRENIIKQRMEYLRLTETNKTNVQEEIKKLRQRAAFLPFDSVESREVRYEIERLESEAKMQEEFNP